MMPFTIIGYVLWCLKYVYALKTIYMCVLDLLLLISDSFALFLKLENILVMWVLICIVNRVKPYCKFQEPVGWDWNLWQQLLRLLYARLDKLKSTATLLCRMWLFPLACEIASIHTITTAGMVTCKSCITFSSQVKLLCLLS